jgi:Flp pilus assembly pilin Flp
MKTMSSLKAEMAFFAIDESGAIIMEYALLAVLIAAALAVGVRALTTKVNGMFSNVATKF